MPHRRALPREKRAKNAVRIIFEMGSALRKLVFTMHSRAKMRQYGISEGRVRRVLHTPARVEEGIAEGTIAMMQPISNNKQELWVMIAEKPKERRVVSTWRYPGRTKPGEPLPQDVLRELRAALR